MTWWVWGLVAVAGAIGAPARYLLDSLVTARTDGSFPLGTMVINVSGSFVLGLITGLAMYHGLDRQVKEVVGTGFVGAYTTFSTFGFETIGLMEQRRGRAALTNVAVSLVAGGLAAAAGIALGGL